LQRYNKKYYNTTFEAKKYSNIFNALVYREINFNEEGKNETKIGKK